MMLDGLDTESGRDMCFACARAADQDNVLGPIQELASVQLAHSCLVDLAGGEVVSGDVLIGRETGGIHMIGDGANLRSAISALSNCDSIGTAASKAGAPCSIRSMTPGAMPYIFRSAA